MPNTYQLVPVDGTLKQIPGALLVATGPDGTLVPVACDANGQLLTAGESSSDSGTQGAALAAFSNSAVPADAAVQIVAARETRRFVTVKNTHATVSVWLGPAVTVAVGSGFPLKAGEGVTFAITTALHAIAEAGGSTVALVEEYDS